MPAFKAADADAKCLASSHWQRQSPDQKAGQHGNKVVLLIGLQLAKPFLPAFEWTAQLANACDIHAKRSERCVSSVREVATRVP
jgi:hypothetical protein